MFTPPPETIVASAVAREEKWPDAIPAGRFR